MHESVLALAASKAAIWQADAGIPDHQAPAMMQEETLGSREFRSRPETKNTASATVHIVVLPGILFLRLCF